MRLIVTREMEPVPGWDTIVAPCVAFEPLPVTALPGRKLLLVSSPRSVDVAVEHAQGREVHALAPATSNALEERGVTVTRAVHGGVAELLDGVEPAEAVLLTSDLGVHHAARWPDLHAVATHRTTCPDSLAPEALAALEGEFAVLFASPSAVANFERLAHGAISRAQRVLCHGRSTIVAARRLGALAPEAFNLESLHAS